ncbi:MAG TPA: sulfurtransferase TusA family protein [Rhodocyclaceae bacterium]|jgi:TusA-related sulfurtransferase
MIEGKRTFTADKELDAKGLACPLPILRTKKALAGMESGQVLMVAATDPGSQKDFVAFSKQTGNELMGVEVHDGTVFVFYFRRK